jgi:hypothetical protein
MEADGLIAATGDFHRIGNLRIPIYQIAPSVEFEAAECPAESRAKRREQEKVRGENSAPLQRRAFTPGVQLSSPPNEPSELIEEANASSAREEIEDQVDELTALWPIKTEIIRAKVREALVDAIYADGPFPKIKAAVCDYVRATGGSPKVWLHRFLGHGEEHHRDRAYRPWLPKVGAIEAPVTLASLGRFPEDGVRQVACARKGEAWARSWLDGCGWDGATRTILPRSELVRGRLLRELQPELKAAGVTVGRPGGSQ